jgi:sugar phosphate isomerase/epimerase
MVGIFAKTFPGSNPHDVFEQVRAAGFDSVQYNFACSGIGALPQHVDDNTITAITKASQHFGIGLTALSATYNMTDPNSARRQAGRSSFAALAQAAEVLGIKIITVCSGSMNASDQWQHHLDNDTSRAWSEMCGEFDHIIPIAQKHGLRIGVEPEHGNIVSNAAKARQLLDSYGTETLGIVFDAANLLTESEHATTIETAASLLAKDTILVHAKDRDQQGLPAAPGDGVIDWPHYAKALQNHGCKAPVIAHGFGLEKAKQVSHFLKNHFEGFK